EGKTGSAAAMMTNYSIMVDKDGKPLFGDKLLGTAYNSEIINIFRKDNNYDGLLVTDWGVTRYDAENIRSMGTAWGAEDLTLEQRHFEIIKAGMDMFGGNNAVAPVLEAYKFWDDANHVGDLR